MLVLISYRLGHFKHVQIISNLNECTGKFEYGRPLTALKKASVVTDSSSSQRCAGISLERPRSPCSFGDSRMVVGLSLGSLDPPLKGGLEADDSLSLRGHGGFLPLRHKVMGAEPRMLPGQLQNFILSLFDV